MSKKSKLSIWLSCLLYRFLLENVYTDFLAPRWASYGFRSEVPSSGLYVFMWMMHVISIPWLITLLEKATFSAVNISCLILFAYMPAIVHYTYQPIVFMPEYLAYWLCIFIFYSLSNLRLSIPFRIGRSEDKFIKTVSIWLFLLSFYVWAVYSRFHIQTSLLDVYGQRQIASRWNMSFILTYIFSSIQFMVPFIVAVAIDRKHYRLVFLVFAAQVINFFAQGSKSSIFGVVLSMAAYFFFRSAGSLKRLPFAAMMLALGTLLECMFSSTSFILDVFLRRALFVPTLLNIHYYDYFSKNPPDYYMGNFMRLFGFSSKYTRIYGSIPKLIGLEYFRGSSMYANNGLFSDAWSELGIPGLVILPFFLVAV